MNICLAWSASDFNPTKCLFFIHSPKRNIYCSILKAIIKSLHNFFGTKIEIEFENEKNQKSNQVTMQNQHIEFKMRLHHILPTYQESGM